jgi:uncharacterized protein DUF4397
LIPTRKLLALLGMTVLLFSLAACSDDDDPMSPVDDNMDLGTGVMLRIVHASPDAPSVDVYAKGISTPIVTALSYTQTTNYLDLAPGNYTIELRAHGADPMSTPAFETGELTLPDGAVITAVAAGLLGSSDMEMAFRVIPLVEGFEDMGSDMAEVRIIHAGADAPTVAIDVGNDGNPEILNFARYADTGAAGVALPTGTPLDVGIWAGDPLARVTAFQTPSLPDAGLILIATGLLGEQPGDDMGFGLLAVGPDGTIGLIRQNPTVYVMHASPDAPAVDVFVGGTNIELVDMLSFGALSAPVQVPPASYELDIKVAESGAPAATVMTPELMAGGQYLAVASGFVSGGTPEFALLPFANSFDKSASPLVRVVHASPDAPSVDVGLWDDGMNFTAISDYSDLVFGEASDGAGLAISAMELTVGVAPTGTTTPAATFDLSLANIDRAFAVAAGSLGGIGEAFRLIVVDATTSPWQAAQIMPNP